MLKRVNEIQVNPSDDLAALETFSNVFEGLGCLSGREYEIRINPSVVPVQLPPRQVPFKIRELVKAELQRMENMGVISKVTEPTEWISQMVVVAKPNGAIRVCLDPRELNKAILRQHYPMNTLEAVVSQMSDVKILSKFDATSGYWQLPLTEKSAKITTFNTPWGRYQFKRMPFGISSASEIWQRAMIELLEGLEGVHVIVDDILLYCVQTVLNSISNA